MHPKRVYFRLRKTHALRTRTRISTKNVSISIDLKIISCTSVGTTHKSRSRGVILSLQTIFSYALHVLISYYNRREPAGFVYVGYCFRPVGLSNSILSILIFRILSEWTKFILQKSVSIFIYIYINI